MYKLRGTHHDERDTDVCAQNLHIKVYQVYVAELSICVSTEMSVICSSRCQLFGHHN